LDAALHKDTASQRFEDLRAKRQLKIKYNYYNILQKYFAPQQNWHRPCDTVIIANLFGSSHF
jgi:hypothetical protein